MRKAFAVVLLLASEGVASKSEADYQQEWCKGETEVVMPDRSRADCVTDRYAIEVEFANKWKDGIGQALNYAFQTNKKAGIALILRDKGDYRYWIQLNSVIDYYDLPITPWKIEGY
ncbi:hypothetical protein [Gilvimarinus chinensis]|uniref:hypothetical protein n=1 Tax=Gilvimarinus chinensis TaxID=396005 RepID=UPI00036516A6|nr:hypothetical protein [Gilvimarinus chinensis]